MKIPIGFRVSLLLVPLAWALAGCGAREPVAPVSTASARDDLAIAASGAAGAALDPLWPNEDGRRWDYRYFARTFDAPAWTIHADAADVPPAPELADLLPLLTGRGRDIAALPEPGGLITEPYQLLFNGQGTTASGVTAQNLEEHMLVVSPRASVLERATWSARFAARLAQVRADLRPRLETMGVRPSVEGFFRLPLFLHGGVWQKTADYAGTYGDADTSLAWKFLDAAALAPGSSFVFQLVPTLAPDVFLHALVVPHNQQRRLRGYARDVQVAYMIDYGIATVTDQNGQPSGYVRGIDLGLVIYAPGVGPVAAFERFGGTSDDPARVDGANEITLVQVTAGTGAGALSLTR